MGTGLVSSLARPGGNLTGFSGGLTDLCGKWLELLQEAIPRLSTVAVLANPTNPVIGAEVQELRSISQKRGLKIVPVYVREPEALVQAMAQARHSSKR